MMLELDQVTRMYPGPPPIRALDAVTLAVAAGELVAVAGPSGAGKSTLLRLLAGQDRPDGGAVRVTGRDLGAMSEQDRAGLRAASIGLVPQRLGLADEATALDNVAESLLPARAELAGRRERAAAALTRVGLGDRLAARPAELSGGERQRVAIARAVAGRPPIILADNPTGHLDAVTAESVLALLTELHQEGATVVVVTHDEDLAACLPRRVELSGGRIVVDTAPPAPAEWPRVPR